MTLSFILAAVVGPDPVTTAQPELSLPPSYIIEAGIDIITPTCIMLTWELNHPSNANIFNGSRVATVKLWRIVLNVQSYDQQTERSNNQRTERSVQSNDRLTEKIDELILAGSRTNITLGPFALGSAVRVEVHLQKYVGADGRTRDSSSEGRPDITVGMCSKDLPSTYDLVPMQTLNSQHFTGISILYCQRN